MGGSLGQGLGQVAGMAYVAMHVDEMSRKEDPMRLFCLLGDGELNEGSVWEAVEFVSVQKLTNIVALVDVNGMRATSDTAAGYNLESYARRFQVLG